MRLLVQDVQALGKMLFPLDQLVDECHKFPQGTGYLIGSIRRLNQRVIAKNCKDGDAAEPMK